MDVVGPVVVDAQSQGKNCYGPQTAVKRVTAKIFRIIEFSVFNLINVQQLEKLRKRWNGLSGIADDEGKGILQSLTQ